MTLIKYSTLSKCLNFNVYRVKVLKSRKFTLKQTNEQNFKQQICNKHKLLLFKDFSLEISDSQNLVIISGESQCIFMVPLDKVESYQLGIRCIELIFYCVSVQVQLVTLLKRTFINGIKFIYLISVWGPVGFALFHDH